MELKYITNRLKVTHRLNGSIIGNTSFFPKERGWGEALKLITLFIALGFVFACSKKESLDTNISGLGGDSWTPTALDNWLYDSITHPYNIQVKYKWDQFELDLNKTLVPPLESQVQPVMDALRQIWINTYNAEAGLTFFKKYSPKIIVAVGSPSYNPDGSVTLGTAEGGKRVVLYGLNSFDNTNVDAVKQMVHIVEHEFGHILNQNVLYSPDFKLISVGKYTANWINETDEQAQAEGFISAYAKAAPDEDFVEMISLMLSNGRMWFEMMVNSENADAAAALRAKETQVVSYYKEVWDIDFYSLQTRVQQAIDKVTVRTTLPAVFGFGKTYSSIVFDPATLLGASPDFLNIFNTVNNSLANDYGVTLDSMKIKYTAVNKIVVQLFFNDTQNDYAATYTFNATTDANGVIKLTYASADNNGTIIKTDAQPLLNYFTQYHFTLQWGTNRVQGSTDSIGAFTPVENAAVYYAGVLGN